MEPKQSLQSYLTPNRVLGGIALLAVIIGTLSFFVEDEQVTQEVNPEPVLSLMRVAQPTLGFSFAYNDSQEDGYILSEITKEMEQEPTFLGGYLLTGVADAKNQEGAMEGPPTISIRVFENAKKEFPAVWADTHPLASNIQLRLGESKEAVVGGANAIRYRADGLYASENLVVAHGSKIYVLSGSFMDEASPIRADFEELVASIEFIPAE